MEMIKPSLLIHYGADIKTYDTNETIFEEGAHCNYYFQIIDGSVKWCNIHEDGKEFIQSLVLAGESFGDIPLFDDGPYISSAIANEKTEVFRLPKQQFLLLLEEHPDVLLEMTRMIAARLRFKFLLVKEISHKNPTQIIISLLDYLTYSKRSICPDCNMVKLTRQQIADMTGLRVETVIRVIKQLEKDGIVSINRGKIKYHHTMREIINA